MSKNVNFGSMPSLNSSSSFGSGILSRFKTSSSLLSWSTLGMILFVIILVIVAYSVYQYYVYPLVKPTYKENSEIMPAGSSEGMGNNGNEVELLLFSADWCPHCKKAKPEWEQVKAEYQGKQIKGYTIIFTDVNCTTDSPDVEKMMNTYKVEGYPTIKLIKDNQVIDFDAKPTKDTLEQFINTVI